VNRDADRETARRQRLRDSYVAVQSRCLCKLRLSVFLSLLLTFTLDADDLKGRSPVDVLPCGALRRRALSLRSVNVYVCGLMQYIGNLYSPSNKMVAE